ncbi:MAG: Kazal-type serine protease inhibitor domain-containing protein [Alphaproteobacteria bacterium]|jgi:hypothetical protein
MKLAAALFIFYAATLPAAADCPLVLKPVCGLAKDGSRAKFANACVAERKGARVLHDGECTAPGKEPMMCSMIYKPVCATDPATKAEKTYSSLCVSETADAAVVHDGECAVKKSGE